MNSNIKWELFTDNETNFSYIRLCPDALGPGAYEVLRVTKDGDNSAEFVHRVLFRNDYSEESEKDVADAMGFSSIEGFREAVGTTELSFIGHILEVEPGRRMSWNEAIKLSNKILAN